MKYDQPKSLIRSELQADLESGEADRISRALTGAALHDPDRAYVEALIVRFLQHRDPWVRGVAALAAGHTARVHRQISADIVPMLKQLLSDKEASGKAQDALDDIKTFVAGIALN